MQKREENEEGEQEEEYDEGGKWWWLKNPLAPLKNEFASGSAAVVSSRGTVPSEAFVIHPESWWYLLWKHFILLWAVYSSFFTPFEFGFYRGLPERLFLLDIAGQLVFLIDIVVHFFVAYRDLDSYRMIYKRKLIALRYLKSRFFIDLLGCFPWDYIYKISGRKEPVRYLLWIRLSRSLRVTEFFERLEKDIRINYLFIRIVKLLVVEYYCTHTAACMFYYLATTLPPSEEGYTWIGSLKMGDFSYSHFTDIDIWKRYVTSLYFAIVTMATVGYGDIHAVNVREMIFVMIYVSFDMILGAYLLGNMTALIVKGSKTEKFRDRIADLNKFMNKNRLGKHISTEIKAHLKLQYDRGYTKASVLQDVPESLCTKISQKLYEPYIKEVSLFRGCSARFIRQMATRVHEEYFIPGEVVIEQGCIADQLYVLCHGELEELGRKEDEKTENVLEWLQTYRHKSFGELSVLCNTPQPSTIRACDLCRVLRLDKQSFIELLEIYFIDGRIILNNLLEGKDTSLQNKILNSDIRLHIRKHEMEMATRVNCAAYDGDLSQLKLLIGAGADANETDYEGRSPLYITASRGFEEIARFLIEKGVDVNMSDKSGNTPLFEAIKNGHDKVASLLSEAGASLMVDDAGEFLCRTVMRRDLDLLRRVLAYGINANAKNYDRRTALHIASSEGLYPMAKILLEGGASVLSKDRWGNTPLDEARIGGNKDLISLLEGARTIQSSELSNFYRKSQDETRWKRCTVFPFHPWDLEQERRQGVVLWVPQTIEDLIKEATQQLNCSSGNSCILSENGGEIVNINMITHDEKLYLVGKE